MKVVTVIGARPQFIKAAVVSRVLSRKHREILVHTGQHFDYNMSKRFFEELDIPEPDYNLGISGGSHAQMTGKMMIALEEVLVREEPDWLLVYGDTNSTLAAALSSAKLHIPICHVEAGVRSGSMTNPEEINRVCTDHVSRLLLTSTERGLDALKKENLIDRAQFVGDPMYDAFLRYSKACGRDDIKFAFLTGGESEIPREYYYLTCHREENTKDDGNLLEIFYAMEKLDAPVIYPVHPRNRERALRLNHCHGFKNLLLSQPVGYLESICLVNHAKAVITDSGGLQREAFFAEKKCVTVLDSALWPETMVCNRNLLARPDREDILQKLGKEQKVTPGYRPFGDGHSAEKIVMAMERNMGKEG